MVGRWNEPGIPHRGWICTGVEDLADVTSSDVFYETCMMCGQEKIRYVHIMSHFDFDNELRVGCICAGKMSDDYAGAKDREKELRNKASRKLKWLSRRWRTSKKGNSYLNIDGNNIGIFPRNGVWYCRINDLFGNKGFRTENEAKIQLFEMLWQQRNR